MAGKRIVIPNYMPALDLNGNPLAGAKITFYENETTTLASVYADEALTVPLTNPVISNLAGVFPSIFADEDLVFTVAINDANDNPIGGLRNKDEVRPSQIFGADSAAAENANAAAQTALAQILDLASGAPDAPSILNKLNKDGDNADAALLANIGATATGEALFTAADPATARRSLLADRSAVADKAALTALPKAQLATGDVVATRAATGAYDGGQAEYVWNAADTQTANGGTVLASGEGGAGRWVAKAGVEQVDVRIFGMNQGASAAANSAAFQAAITASYGKELCLPFFGGTVTYDTGVVIDPTNPNNTGISIRGFGGNASNGAALKYTGLSIPAINFAGAATGGVANGDNRPLQFRSFALYGPDENTAGVNGINLFGANGQTLLEDLWIFGFGGDANIYMEQCFGAELNRVISGSPRRRGIWLNGAANNVIMRHVRSFGAGRVIGGGDNANIQISGLASYGLILDGCDFSYAGGNTFARSVGNGGITQIVVAGATATITFGAAHGLSIGNTFGIVGGGLRDLNGYKAVDTVPTATTITAYIPVADGTYNNAELTVTAPATGLVMANCHGALINGWYCETSPQSGYIADCTSLTINGGDQLDAKMILETNVSGVRIGGLSMHGVASTVEFYGSGQNKVDISESVIPTAGASLIRPAVYQSDGKYFGAAPPTVGAWTVGTVVWNTAAAAGGVPGWVCTTAGTPGTWKAMAALAA